MLEESPSAKERKCAPTLSGAGQRAGTRWNIWEQTQIGRLAGCLMVES